VSIWDMVRSVVVLLVPILAFLGYQALVRKEPDPLPPVDYAAAAAAARREAPYPLLAPAALPQGWRATSVRYTPGPQAHWHLGVLTSEEDYVGLEQLVAGPEAAVEAFAAETVDVGTVTIDGATWQLRTDADEEVTLVRSRGEVTTLVTGTVSREVLVDYVESLRSS